MTDPNLSSFLDDDLLDDSQTQDPGLLSPHQDLSGLVHSPTTDTLDSVALGPNEDFSGLEDVLAEEGSGLDQSGIEINATADVSVEVTNSNQGQVVDSESKPSEKSDFETAMSRSIGDDIFGEGKIISFDGSVLSRPGQQQEEVSISSYFTSGPDQEDPFGSVVKTPSTPTDVTKPPSASTEIPRTLSTPNEIPRPSSTPTEIPSIPTEIKEDVTHIHHDLLETRISQEEPESVDFSVPAEEGQTNVMESSMQIIDDKEDFESFTAESGPTDLDRELGLGTSPGNKFLAERMGKMHLEDNADFTCTDYGRQLSTASNHSLGGIPAPPPQTPPVVPSPVHQPFQGAPLSPSQISPFTTPSHQPASADILQQGMTATEPSNGKLGRRSTQNSMHMEWNSGDLCFGLFIWVCVCLWKTLTLS